ncbi:MAG: TIGR03067 domain-containing protein [Verrucomicrobiota bacterium]
MKIATLLTILSLAGVLAAFAGPKADDTKDIQGTWLPVKAELSGKPMPEEFLKKIVSLKLDSGKYVVTAESLDKGTYTMDAAAKPRTIDITGTEGPNVGKKIPAIYELNGDTLRICYNLGGDTHPTEFKSPPGTKIFLVTYQRKKA